jgi:predicted nucleic acid-binding protein
MGPLVDTSVLVDAYRGAKTEAVRSLRHFLLDGPVPATVPIVVQEVLQGTLDERHHVTIATELRAFEQLPSPSYALHEQAARLFRRARREGITSSTVDVLLVAIAAAHGRPLLTADRVQQSVARLVGVELA